MVFSFKEAAEIICDTLKSKYPQIDRAFVFGSFAEGSQTLESDLDILVELNTSMGLEFIEMIQDIEKAAGMPVDVLTIRQANELEKKFGYNILKKARPIYERTKN